MKLDRPPKTPESGNVLHSRFRKEKAIRLPNKGFQGISWRRLTLLGILGFAICGIATHPPIKSVAAGEVGLRVNQWTGSVVRFRDGLAPVIPLVHDFRTYSLRDRVYRPNNDRENGFFFQSIEGLTLGADFTVRYALNVDRLPAMAHDLPNDIDREIVLPIIQGVLHKTFSRHTVREILSSRRHEIQDEITRELRARMSAGGIKFKSITLDKITLPTDYLTGAEKRDGGSTLANSTDFILGRQMLPSLQL
ncbi:MAG: hypothetical protein LBV29_02785 [Azoarcus sp.]|jgi:regulator of protease activity HflC (stomatin/prohibitin superfamily)|nr:hypothetical protein [Azoarcus sp.]